MRGGARIEPILAVDGLTVHTKQQVTLIEGVTFSIQLDRFLVLSREWLWEDGDESRFDASAQSRRQTSPVTSTEWNINSMSLSERTVRTIRGGEMRSSCKIR